MKIFLKRALFLMCALTLVFGLVGCPTEPKNSSGGGTGGGTIENESSGIEVPSVSLDGDYYPKKNESTAYEDGLLMIRFDSVPTVNRDSGKVVKVLDADGVVVDTIKPKDETLSSNAKNEAYQKINVKDQLISVNGNVVVIKLHKSLENGKAYSVNIEDGLLSGKVNGVDFAGITDNSWSFTTRAAPSISGNTITVGKDKNFSTVQGALNYLKNESGDWTIEIDEGYYHEYLSYCGAANVTMIGMQEGFDARSGEDGNVVIYWANANVWNGSTRQRAAFLWEGGNLKIKNLTISNNIDRADIGKDGTQAEALYYDAVGKVVAYNASFKSHQDTLLIGNNGGRGWFYQCYVEGDTDFIWGYPATVLFEECQIRCLYDDAPAVTTHTSYIFASRSDISKENNKGLVLFNSKIKVDNGVKAYYGRNSGSDTQATVVYNTFEKIEPELWFEGSTKYDEDIEGVSSIGYKDFGNVLENGNGISTSNRKEGTYDLSKEVAEREYSGRNAILNRGWDAEARRYVAVAEQWDLSELEEEFNASEDKSKSVIYLEPTYVPYLAGTESTNVFVATNYAGQSVDVSEWIVDNSDLATVENGVVTAKEEKDGIVTITAMSEEKHGVARVKVIPQVIPATGLAFDKTEAFTISKDDVVTLNAIFTPENTTDKNIEWTSSDSNVLRVVGGGALGTGTSAEVTGFGKGTATITAKSIKHPEVFTTVEITVKDVNTVSYLLEGAYTKNATIAHRDATVVAEPVSYGFAGNVGVVPPTAEIAWGNNGWKFDSADVVANEAGADFAWADFKIRAAGDIKLTALTSSMYCSATSNLRGKVYVKVGDGEFVEKGEASADAKQMQFNKQDITTSVKAGEEVTVRVAIATLEEKTVNKKVSGVIGNVVIYYDIEGTPVAFPGADGNYNIIDYYAGDGSQWSTIEDGTSADGMVSWESIVYHSAGYGAAVSGSSNTGYVNIKVGGPSVISIIGSQYGNGTLTVTNSSDEVIAGPASTKMESDKSTDTRTLSFLYTAKAEDTLKLAFTGTSYIGTISVKELTTEKAEVKSVTINGAEEVSTAVTAGFKFTAVVDATYCASTAVTWSSSDEAVATVDANGVVKGLKAGTATITATSVVDSTKSATFDVTVIEEIPVPDAETSYAYNFADKSTVLEDATTGSSTDTFLAWDANWKYHGGTYGAVATANNAQMYLQVAGNVVIGYSGYEGAKGSITVTDADGNAIQSGITAKTDKGGFNYFIYKGDATTLTINVDKTDCYIAQVTVRPWAGEVPAVTSVAIDESKEVAIGAATKLTLTVNAEYFADPSVTWSSSDETIAIVDENGVVTGVAAGTATITATSVNNLDVNATCEVTVTAESAVINTNTFDFTKGIENIVAEEDATKTLTLTGCGFQDATNYGAKNAGTATFDVTGPALITFYPTYKMDGTVTLYTSGDTTTPLAEVAISTGGNDAKIPKAGSGEAQDPLLYAKSVMYTGDAATLDLAIAGSNVYFWKIVVTYPTVNTFDFTKGITDIVAEEDATKTLTLTGCGFQDATNYGAKNAGTATFDVTGPALITFYPTYKMDGTVTLYTSGDTTTPLAEVAISTGGNDAKIPKAGSGEAQDPLLYAKSVMYTGDAATLDLAIAGSNVYFWKIVVNQF